MARTVTIIVLAVCAAAAILGVDAARRALFSDWPPRFARPFPDIALVDSRGADLRVGDLAGRVVLVHAVDMASPVSNALAGGGALGGVGGVRAEAGARPLEFLLARHGARPGDPRLAVLHLLLYDAEGGAPDRADAALWAAHFRLDGRANVHVAAPRGDLRGPAAAALAPGAWLLDRDGFVRYAAVGDPPRHDLETELLPAAARLMAGPAPRARPRTRPARRAARRERPGRSLDKTPSVC